MISIVETTIPRKGQATINIIYEHTVIAQQIALNNKMYERGHISKHTRNNAHNILTSMLTNIATKDMAIKTV